MPAPLTPTPLSALKVESHQIAAHAGIPNTSLQRKPLLIYRSAFPPSATTTTASALEAHLAAVAVVQPRWRYTMYATTHFHSTTHEVLAVAAGAAQLCFGGEENPHHVEAVVRRGDVVVVPAGVGHRLLRDLSEDPADASTSTTSSNSSSNKFEMVGCYPVGAAQWDMCYGTERSADADAARARIERLKWFARDPVYGSEGPVLDV